MQIYKGVAGIQCRVAPATPGGGLALPPPQPGYQSGRGGPYRRGPTRTRSAGSRAAGRGSGSGEGPMSGIIVRTNALEK